MGLDEQQIHLENARLRDEVWYTYVVLLGTSKCTRKIGYSFILFL